MSNPSTNETGKPVHGAGQKMAYGANAALVVFLTAAIVVMINYIAFRHADWFWLPNRVTGKTEYRFDWTRSAYYKLSDKTKQIVRKLDKPVQFILFSQITSQMDQRLQNDLKNLMKEYEELSKNIQFRVVDVDRNPMEAATLIKQNEITTANTVSVTCGAKKKYLSPNDIMDISGGGNPYMPQPERVTAFKGEQAITGAILSVTEEKQKKVYFLAGHGEKDPEQFDPKKGYSTIATRLKQDNMLVEKFKLSDKHKIPDDCDVLVIAGPMVPFTAEEIDLIGKYLDNRGRLYVMIDPQIFATAQGDTGLEPLLEKWNVHLDNDVILAKVAMIGEQAVRADVTQAGEYGNHVIVAKLKDIDTAFPVARSLAAIESGNPAEASPDKPRVTVLVKTPESGFWGETDLRGLQRGEARYDKTTDKGGAMPLAVAVERGGNVAGVDVGASRLVVVGTSSFLLNQCVMAGGNSDFFLNGVNWLLQREEKIAISPKTPEEFKFTLAGNRGAWFCATILFGIPGSVALLGVAVWMRRRR